MGDFLSVPQKMPIMRLAIRWMFIAVLAVLALSWWLDGKRKMLPDESQIVAELDRDPIQTPTADRAFIFEYLGDGYRVEPVANYRIWGLVVTHNDIHSFIDIYHDENSVDFKDLCVIWGDNIIDNVHKKFHFWSEPWTCFMQADDRADYQKFNRLQISNNHLLSDQDWIRQTISDVTIGDQIYLEGQLINYAPRNQPLQLRKSSLVRSDTGNGACEVMFVDDVKVLKKGNPIWHQRYHWSRVALKILLLGLPLMFLLNVYLEQR